MNQQLRDKWLEALRSGDYKQGRNRWSKKSPDSSEIAYCCLGVLCVVADVPVGGINSRKAVKAIVGDDKNEDAIVNDCIIMNDIHMKSFPEIADWLEKELV